MDNDLFDYVYVSAGTPASLSQTIKVSDISAKLDSSTKRVAMFGWVESEVEKIENSWSTAVSDSLNKALTSLNLKADDVVGDSLCLRVAVSGIRYSIDSSRTSTTIVGPNTLQTYRQGSGYLYGHGIDAEVASIVLEANLEDCDGESVWFYVLDKMSPNYGSRIRTFNLGYKDANNEMLDRWILSFLNEMTRTVAK